MPDYFAIDADDAFATPLSLSRRRRAFARRAASAMLMPAAAAAAMPALSLCRIAY